MKVAVIGGGAAGFFSALAVKGNYPEAEVTIFEKSNKVLSKVKVSGGGRCNVTNGCQDIDVLSNSYPRGAKALRKLFGIFNTAHTIEWFESRGVPLVIQPDNCVFPISQNSQSIIDCFLMESKKLNVKIVLSTIIKTIDEDVKGLSLIFNDDSKMNFDSVIIATGGSPKKSGLMWLEKMGHRIEDPVPSLFTFNMPNEPIRSLMGIVVENASATIEGSRLNAQGPLLITHWGMSGPAILKLSAFGARYLSEKNYDFNVHINWVDEKNSDKVYEQINKIIQSSPNKLMQNVRPYFLPERLWIYLLDKCGLNGNNTWSQLGNKGKNKLVNSLTNDVYKVNGKTTFKEEFVTCGGISLESINMKTMQSKVINNLYFAGELIDIDGITGGYNFQAAWTTGFIAGKLQ